MLINWDFWGDFRQKAKNGHIIKICLLKFYKNKTYKKISWIVGFGLSPRPAG
jgi:hypothetical protein